MGYVDWMVVLYQGGFSDLEGCLVVRQECLCLGEIHTGELRSHGWGGGVKSAIPLKWFRKRLMIMGVGREERTE